MIEMEKIRERIKKLLDKRVKGTEDATEDWFADGRTIHEKTRGYSIAEIETPMRADLAHFIATHEPKVAYAMWNVIIAAETWRELDFGDEAEAAAAMDIVEALEELRELLEEKAKVMPLVERAA